MSCIAASFLSSTLGIMKFLKTEPCQLLPNNGFMNGFCQFGNILALFSTLFCLLGKLLSIVYVFTYKDVDSNEFNYNFKFVVWICLLFMPQLLIVS